MATTAIWPVKGWVGHVINYTENQEKTQNKEWSQDDLQGLRDVMDYTLQDSKTEKQFYVSGINCDPTIARQQMMLTKQQWQKEKGVVAYHGYQSFKPGEVTPEQAHEIGMRMAKEMWGEKYQVVVATHLDKSHIHNHFVVNSVSYVDGVKWGNTFTDYYRDMRGISDRLCKEYSLSVIEVQTDQGSFTKSHKEWQDEKEGKETWRGLIRKDIDEAVKQSVSWNQFITSLKGMGYEVKTGVKHMAVRPPGKERFVRLRSLGDNYTEEALKQLVMQNWVPEQKACGYEPLPERKRCKGRVKVKTVKLKGFRALYFSYMYKMGILQRHPYASNKRLHFLLREDILKLDRITDGFCLLNSNKIETFPELNAYRDTVRVHMNTLYEERRGINLEKQQISDENELSLFAIESNRIKSTLKDCRKELMLCDDIEERSKVMAEKLKRIRAEGRDVEHKEKPKRQTHERSWLI